MNKHETLVVTYVFLLIAVDSMVGCNRHLVIQHKADKRVQELESKNWDLQRQLDNCKKLWR